jgi:drug/metabolite transporter (DMT)-like permease
MGAVFLHESVSPQRWAGTLLIVAGAALTSLTPHATEQPAADAPARESAE